MARIMNRSIYFDYISERLSTLALQIEVQGKLNVLNLHHHSEDFYMHFMNKLFGWKLENVNVISQNVEAIDLKDDDIKRKILAQVSATATKQKIESALKKDLSIYPGYCFKFISISKDAEELRSKSYKNPHNIAFAPQTDIHDIKSMLAVIDSLDIERQFSLFDFIKKELGHDTDQVKTETNIANVVNILAAEEWDISTGDYQTKSFEIDRKIDHNKLCSAKHIVHDYAVNQTRVDKIYQEFNKQGINKSSSVLSSIHKMYLTSKDTWSDDALFFNIIDQVVKRVQNSKNYIPIPFEELDLCANILVVDAFIRCKIFENPEGYSHAAS